MTEMEKALIVVQHLNNEAVDRSLETQSEFQRPGTEYVPMLRVEGTQDWTAILITEEVFFSSEDDDRRELSVDAIRKQIIDYATSLIRFYGEQK
jgi:hypothetical protein